MTRLPRAFLAATLMVITGCSSGGNVLVEEPEIRVAQVNTSEFVQERGGTFSVNYLLEIENKADIPITAEWIELQTAATSPYTIRQTTSHLKHEIPARGTELIELSVWAYSYGGLTAAREPVTLRMRIRFNSAKGSFQVRKIERILQ